MKITWFAKTCFRLHLGGKIIVTDPGLAPDGVSEGELTAGADHIVRLSEADLEAFDAQAWRRGRPHLPVDGDSAPPPALFGFGGSGLFIDAPGEAPLVLAAEPSAWGRFADTAVVVLVGTADALVTATTLVATAARPRIIALAANAFDDEHLAALAEAAAGTPVQLLEPGLALEI